MADCAPEDIERLKEKYEIIDGPDGSFTLKCKLVPHRPADYVVIKLEDKMTVFDRITKAELTHVIECFFQTDHDLTSCIVTEKPVGDEFYDEINKLRLRNMRDDARFRERLHTINVEDTKLAVQALVTGYVLGKESAVR